MSKKTGYVLGILITCIVGMILSYLTCCGDAAAGAGESDSNQVTTNDTGTDATRAATFGRFELKDPDGTFKYDADGNFNFNTSGFSILQPLDGSVEKAIPELKSFLDENRLKQLNVFGLYRSDEENTSAYPNLGEGRANSVKSFFIKNGINSAQINTKGVLDDNFNPDGDIMRGPINYRMMTMNDDSAKRAEEELNAIKKSIQEDPLVLYFATGQASIALTPAQRQKVADINRYVGKVDGAKALVIGHTDNVGKRALNVRLGQERADFAAGYLKKNGIPDSKVEASSKGPDQPVATNDTKKGQAQNRRVVVTVNN